MRVDTVKGLTILSLGLSVFLLGIALLLEQDHFSLDEMHQDRCTAYPNGSNFWHLLILEEHSTTVIPFRVTVDGMLWFEHHGGTISEAELWPGTLLLGAPLDVERLQCFELIAIPDGEGVWPRLDVYRLGPGPLSTDHQQVFLVGLAAISATLAALFGLLHLRRRRTTRA